MKTIQVIVNADDLGASAEVNDSTFDLVDRGLVTSATILANAPAVEDACRRAGHFPHCSFGVHLNVTEFCPITAPEKLEPILGDQGELGSERIREISIDRELADGIFEEFCAQIQRLKSLGIRVGHIDSHHHVHTISGVFPILKKVQKRFQIRKVRISRNIYTAAEGVSKILLLKKLAYNTLLRHYYRTTTTQGFSDFEAIYESARMQRLNHRCVEAMVHPGNPSYKPDEIELLKGPWRESLGIPVQLISYAELE